MSSLSKRKLKTNMPVTFVPEPDNPYNPKAVIVNSGDIEIGYFHKAAEKYLQEDYPVFVEDIEEDGNDKYVIKVVVFLYKICGGLYPPLLLCSLWWAV